MSCDDEYIDILTQQNDIVYNEEYVVDGDIDSLSTLGWFNERGESIPYNIDTMGWYEDVRSQDSIIGFILSKKYKSKVKIVMRRAIPHPSDIVKFQLMKTKGENPGEYPFRYERYEIRTSEGNVFTHILSGSVDYSNDNFLQFEIDNDLNDKIADLGSAIRKQYFLNDETPIRFIKKIILDYNKIESIEPIIHKCLY